MHCIFPPKGLSVVRVIFFLPSAPPRSCQLGSWRYKSDHKTYPRHFLKHIPIIFSEAVFLNPFFADECNFFIGDTLSYLSHILAHHLFSCIPGNPGSSAARIFFFILVALTILESAHHSFVVFACFSAIIFCHIVFFGRPCPLPWKMLQVRQYALYFVGKPGFGFSFMVMQSISVVYRLNCGEAFLHIR